MARFVSHPLGVDLRHVLITFKPASILMTANIRRFTGGVHNGNVGLSSVVINLPDFRSAGKAASVRSHQPGPDRVQNLFLRHTRSFFAAQIGRESR